jgi:hypothetical protein
MFLSAADRQIGNRFHKIMKCFQWADKRVNQSDLFFVNFITSGGPGICASGQGKYFQH